jgi:hypothetical protein
MAFRHEMAATATAHHGVAVEHDKRNHHPNRETMATLASQSNYLVAGHVKMPTVMLNSTATVCEPSNWLC